MPLHINLHLHTGSRTSAGAFLYIKMKYANFLVSLSAVLCMPMTYAQAFGANRIYSTEIRTLQTTVDNDWLSTPVVSLDKILSGENSIVISFDEMSHDYRRLIYHIERCEADWQPSTELFESDWLEGFNDTPIDDFNHSINTTVLYTNYRLTLPNDRCRLKMSGNYRVIIYDEDAPDTKLAEAEFMVVDNTARLYMSATTNTDIDVNKCHQQLSMRLDYINLNVTNPSEQLITVVRQNNRDDNMRWNIKPDITTTNGLIWQHNRQLIFEGGNEYHKYEMLDLSHPTMGIDHISWNGTTFDVYPFVSEPRLNYSYDEGADGAFCIRNSEYTESDYTCDYAWVHYTLHTGGRIGDIMINGWWTTDNDKNTYIMEYDDKDASYHLSLLQKQGYYSYQFLQIKPDGHLSIPESEGNFHETSNTYQALTYYRPQGGRTWLLAAYSEFTFPLISERH